MADLILNDVDPPLLDYLRLSAQATGRTVEQVAKQAIENGVKLDKQGLLAIADDVRSHQTRPIKEDSTEIIRRLRDS